MEIFDLSALELGARIQSREIGVAEAARACLDRIAAVDKTVNAFITVTEREAMAQAEAVQRRIDSGELTHPLAGVPMAVKDLISTKGVPTTCASRMLENYVPVFDATVVGKLNAIGAVCLGKTNMDEFAMGSSTESSYFGVTRNPWDETRVPGGSSGGSAAAVAAREVFYALGSDTGGSIRQPASFCGVTGIKPTYGAVSRYGLLAYASSLDQIGPLTVDAADAAAVTRAIMGRDLYDSTSVDVPLPDMPQGDSLTGLRVGIPEDYFGEGLGEDVRARVLEMGRTLEALGAELVPVKMPMLDYAIPAYYVLACAEASSNLSRYDGVKYGFRPEKFEDLHDLYITARSEGFGAEVKRRIMLGAFALSSGYYDAYYNKALRVKALIKRAFDACFEQADVLLTPAAPTTAYKLGAHTDDPIQMYLGDIYTVSVNMAGLPGMVVPCGFDGDGLPVGAQLIGRAFGEQTLFAAAHAYQLHTDAHKRHPHFGKEG
ncbi:MAG: Asp-tRNA(Asn)/Glu-tRNA(Gln) amidotransferase subunit GatA [Clostridia bacterium]|nr:Asp-tRNA(Asn)/Glu-tRNA(Gln) amidotransferase subunit GatA [Clostridia bacterium]